MSKIIEGKITNQSPWRKLNGKVNCGKCGKTFDSPEMFQKTLKNGSSFQFFSYLQTERYIYETNTGSAIVYCSDYCRKKHNHRFQKG